MSTNIHPAKEIQTKGNAMFTFNIRTKLTLLLLVFGLLPILAVMPIIFSKLNEMDKLTLASHGNTAEEINELIDRNLFERYGDVQAFCMNAAAHDTSNWYKASEASPLVTAMNSYMTNYGIYKLMMIVDTEGKVAAVNTADNQGKALNVSSIYGRSFKDASWFQKVMHKEFLKGEGLDGTVVEQPRYESLISDIYRGEDGFTITFAAPVHDTAGKTIGVWVNFADFGLVENIVKSVHDSMEKDGDKATAIAITDAAGTALVNYDPAEHVDTNRVTGGIGKKTIASLNIPAAEEALKSTEGSKVEKDFGSGEEDAVSWSRSDGALGYPGLGWTVLVHQPAQYAFEGVVNTKRVLYIIMAGSFFVILTIGSLLGKLASTPLLKASSNIKSIAEGEYDITIEGTERKDEIGTMANSLADLKKALYANTRVQTSLDCVTSGVMLADDKNTVVYMNPSVREMFKVAEADIRKEIPAFDASKLLGMDIDSLAKRAENQHTSVAKHESTYQTSITIGTRIFDLIANPVFDGKKRRIGTVVEWQDVTQKRALDKILEDCQGQVQALNRSQASIEFTLDGTITKANEHFLKALGYTFEEIKGKHHSMFVDPKYAASPEYKEFWADLAAGKFKADQYIRFAKNGNEVWIQATYNPVMDVNGKPFKVVKYAVDVTYRRAETLRSQRVQTSLDCVTSNVMLADETNTIIYMNPSVINMMKAAEADIRKQLPNFDTEKLIGSSIDNFHKKPEHQRSMLANLKSVYETSITVGGRLFDLVANPVLGKNNERLGTVVEWKDVTLQKAIEAEVDGIVQASAKGDFSKRLPEAGKTGFMLNLSKGINRIGEVSLNGLTEIGEVINSMSQGDLTKKINNQYEGMFDDIKQALNTTIDKLRDTVFDIKDTAQSVNSASSEISSGSTDLSQRTESQASSLEETAASMEQITSTVKQNSENAQQANALSSRASEVATTGGQVVGNAVKAMERISASSQKIADIIGVIDDIAFQTNLLALNAAVEAARAGEAGKGFAVVASEVRSLAGRSASASKEIKTLINESVDEVKKGSELVNEAGKTLEQIVKSVKDVTGLMSEIASASEQQATGIDEINSAISEMDEGTQQNAALVEENTAAAQSLVEQAGKLESLMEFFRISDKEESPSKKEKAPLALEAPSNGHLKVHTKPVKVATKPITTSKKKPEVSAMKKANGKKMAVSAAEAKFDEGWEEF
ncbi:MAG: PAS domain-containing protein [Proteobacteria bacterium]|nr:PAS domain-containing protein [Pseudomonadota bacterium]